MDTLGKLCPDGTDLPMDVFYTSHFILPFAISSESTYSYSSGLQERIASKPISGNGKYQLFVKFENPLT